MDESTCRIKAFFSAFLVGRCRKNRALTCLGKTKFTILQGKSATLRDEVSEILPRRRGQVAAGFSSARFLRRPEPIYFSVLKAL